MIGKIAQILINIIGFLIMFYSIIVVGGMYVTAISQEELYSFAIEVFISGIIVFGLISLVNYYFFKKRENKKPLFRAMIILLISLVIVTVLFLLNTPSITDV